MKLKKGDGHREGVQTEMVKVIILLFPFLSKPKISSFQVLVFRDDKQKLQK